MNSIEIEWSSEATIFAYSNVAMKFGGFMSKALWDDLAKETTIEGYGVMVADTEGLSGAKLAAANAQYDLYVPQATKANPSLANANQKGDLEGDYYIWSLRITMPEGYYKTSLTAVAYIKTISGYIYLQEVSTSIKELANDYLNNRGYNEGDFGGSLSDLANLK